VFVVLDEPNASLDEAGDAALLKAMEHFKALGTTIVVITHRSSVLSACDLVLLMREGTQQAFGPRGEVLSGLRAA
jgi:ATP-binding cassette subfamily C exporter for protease/lipase